MAFDPSSARLADAKGASSFDPSTAKAQDDPKGRSLLESASDSALALTTGLAQGAQMLSNVAGADNPVAQRFGGIADSLRERESPYRQAQREARGEKIRQAEESGSTWEEVKAYAGAFADAPVDTTLEALGTTAPTLGAALLTGGKSAAAQIVSRAVPAAIGAAQGTGAVKGEIYEAVENRWLDAGATPEEAAARAAQSQSYTGDNKGSIAVGAGLGALAASTGVETAARRLASPWVARKGAEQAAPSILRSTAAGVAREAPIEAVQGGQERLAANLAVQGEGFDQRTWQGVAGQGTLEGLASAPLGGGFGAAEGAAAQRAFRASQPSASPEQEIAGLLSSPVQTGTPSDQILQADTARANAVAEAEARTAEIARRRAEFEAQRAPTPSEQMGLNPADGPMSEAAVMAVDTGAVAGLLPAPVYQGTPSDQILLADIERANSIAQAEARAAEIARRRQEFEAERAPGSPANQWQSMSADERRATLLEAGNWTTQKGDLSVVGKRMVQADWNRINEGARQTIEARMSHAKPVMREDEIDDAAHQAATSPLNNLPEPTEAQKEAGNYAKGHIRLQGLEITVENPRGSDRTGKRPDGSEWRHTMSDHYGYIRRTNGADGEQIDVYVGPAPDSPRVFVVDQIDQQTGRFDEHKAMLGFPDEATAVAAYSSNFDPGWQVGPVRAMAVDEFKTWLAEGDTAKPVAGMKGRQAQATQDLLQRAEPKLDDLRAMSQEAGWAERGGLMLRGPDGEVTGRTPWTPRAEWFRAGMEARPDVLAADIDKMARGEPVPAKSRRTIEGMIEWLDAQQTGVPLAPEDMSSYDLEAMGYEADPAPVQARYDVVDDFRSDGRAPQDTAAQMRALGFTEQEIESELRREAEAGTGSRGERDAGRAQATGRNDLDQQPGEAGAGRAEGGARGTEEGLSLATYTPAELAQREAAQREAEQAEANRQREIEQRQQADAERGDFTLTGSDREADVAAARGQEGLFDQPAARADSAPAAQPETETISDLGEKIGGARKDAAKPVGRRAARAQSDERPAWARRFEIGQVVSEGRDKGKWNIRDSRSKDRLGNARRVAGPFETREEAEAALPLAAVARKHRVVNVGRGDERSFEIWRDVTDRKRVKVVDRRFDSREEALAYMAENAVAIMEANTTFGEADLPVPANKQRIGAARRDGDVAGNDFMTTFGFRGVEFGNWNNQVERQEVMNEAYDGLLDLAEVMDIPPKAISLNGELALAFGARGHGLTGARAHYERNKAVINLTKMNGAGALAHEWFHALDHYFGRIDGKASSQWQIDADGTRSLPADMGSGNDYVTSGFSIGQRSGVRPEVRTAYESLMNTIFRKAETYVEDTTKADKFVGAAKADVQHYVDQIRKDLAEPKDPKYWKRHNKAAPAELLAEFDTLAQQIVEGFSLDTTFKRVEGAKSRSPLAAFRETNDTLDRISEIYKKVRGRTGFTADHSGVLDRMRNAMVRYSQRLKMLADAQNSTEKTKQVPTDFAMDAKSLDQGRGTDYWTTPHEMGARAFQAYVEDKIAAGGGRSPFLNYGPENAAIETPWGWKRPYPAGKERQAINAAIDKLVGVLETRETDQGLMLFSRKKPPAEDGALRQFRETERAYGGREAYERAKAAGKTKLTYGQWVQVRTPNFKAWFGDWEVAGSEPKRQASTFDEARVAARAFQGKPLENRATGIQAVVSRNNLDKMLNGKAVSKSESAPAHAFAVANLDDLFSRALIGWSKPDAEGDPNIKAIHRFFAPVMRNGRATLAKMTVKETAIENDPNPLYTVEAVEFNEKSPAAQWVAAASSADGVDLTSIRSAGDVLTLAQRVQDFNPDTVSKVGDPQTGEPLVVYHGTQQDIESFTHEKGDKVDPGWLGRGFYFTSNPDTARYYATNARSQTGAGNIMPVFLNLRAPYAATMKDKEKGALRSFGGNSDFAIARRQELAENGHDGVVLDFANSGGFSKEIEFVAFAPTQIKSATGNEGAFDATNPDINRSFAGQEAETASHRALRDAQQRVAIGEDAEVVRQDTGWHRGPDGMWRFEISDEDARLEVGGNIASEVLEAAAIDRADVRVVDVLHHPRLFAAYPHLENIRVELMPAGERAAARLVRSIAGQKMQVRGDLKRQALASVMLHELQHAIQHAEGFATGGSRKALVSDMDKTGAETYRRLAGEVEARNTQSRQRMTDEQRRQVAPEDTADVAASDVIVTFNGEPVKAAPANAGARVPVTERGLLRALHYQFRGLVEPVRTMLERGRRGQKGGLVVIDSADPLRVAVTFSSKTGRPLSKSIELFSEAGQINGFFDPSSGLTFLIGPNLDPITAPAVLLHEMIHGQQRQKIDAQAMSMLMNRAQEKDADTRAFLDRVADRMIDAEATADSREAAAYIVEQAVIEGRSQGYRVADSRFFDWADSAFGKKVGDFLRSVAAMVRTWMIRHGGIKALTVDDLVGYALAGVERAAGGEVATSSGNRRASYARDPLAAANMPRQASTFDDARALSKEFQGRQFANERSGILATVSRNSLDKMLSASAVSKSTSPADHALAVANLDHLFAKAEYGWVKQARAADPNVAGIHRLFAPMQTGDGVRLVKITVKESARSDQGGRIYTVEALEIDSPASIWVDSTVRSDGLDPTSTPYAGRIESLVESIRARNNDPQFSRSGILKDAAHRIAGMAPPRTADSFQDLSADQRAFLNKVGTPPAQVRASEWVKARFERIGTKIRQGLVDRYAALKEMDEKLHGKDFIDTAITDSAWVLARMSSAASGAMSAMMTGGRVELDGAQRVVKMKEGDAIGGLMAVLQKLGAPAEVERFFAWVAANRAEKLMAEGREHLFTSDEISAGKALNAGKTESGAVRPLLYAKVFRDFQQYRDDVLAIAEQTGIISAENRAMWRDEFYVPFYRVMDDDGAAGPHASKGLSRQEAYKKLKGGRDNLNDLLENTLMNFHHLLSASMKNQAAAQTVKNAEKLGIARVVPESRRDPKNSTFVLENGDRVFYEIDDPMVFEALTALSDGGLNNFAVRAMSAFKRVFTNMTTVTPQFIIANTLRDLMQATATTPTSKNIAKNFVQGVGAYGDPRARAEMLASGGAFSFGHIYGSDVNEVKANLRRAVKGAELVSSPRMIPALLRKGWDAWGKVTDTSENVSRAATYVQNVEEKGRLRAAFEARDIMDFSQHGAWPAVRFLIRVVPFLNARLQGLDKIYRSGLKPAMLVAMGKGSASDKVAAARFGVVTGALTLATIALYLANYEDEEYRKLEEWQKDTYWFFRIGDHAFFLPKPFEVGAIATMAERVAQQLLDDKATGKLFADRMKDMFLQTFAFNPVPQMFQPALDIYSNKDAFTGRDIETAGMERMSPGLRARDTTTAPARALSAATRVFGDETPFALSPVQADHLIRGYLGSVGATAAATMDTLYRAASGQESPGRRWSEYQPIRRFYRDLGLPAPYTRYSTMFYDGLREANRVYSDLRELQSLGRIDAAAQLRVDSADLLAMRTTLNRQQTRLSEINKEMQRVRRSDGSGEWKRREIDRLNTLKNAITERYGKLIEAQRAA